MLMRRSVGWLAAWLMVGSALMGCHHYGCCCGGGGCGPSYSYPGGLISQGTVYSGVPSGPPVYDGSAQAIPAPSIQPGVAAPPPSGSGPR